MKLSLSSPSPSNVSTALAARAIGSGLRKTVPASAPPVMMPAAKSRFQVPVDFQS